MQRHKPKLTEQDERYIRVGYYNIHHVTPTADQIDDMSQPDWEHYYSQGDKTLKAIRTKEIWGWVAGIAIATIIIAFLVVNNHKAVQIGPPTVSTCFSAQEASNHIGETGCVDYHVGYTYQTSAGTKFLDQYQNYSSGFVGYIPYNSSAATDVNLSDFSDKDVEVSGAITTYSGYTEIIINNQSQITIR